MNRRDLVRAVAAQTDMGIREIDTVIQGFTDVVTAAVAKGEPINISGFAKFAKVERAARWGRNPATGERIRIKASKKARVTPLKGLKDAVANPSHAPKVSRGVLDGSASGRSTVKKAAVRKRVPARKTQAAGRGQAKKVTRR